MEQSTRKISRHVHRSHSTVWRVLDRIKKQNVSKQNVTENVAQEDATERCAQDKKQTRNIGLEIEHYAPAMSSSFNKGLGSVTPQGIIQKAVNDNNQANDFIEFRQAKFKLLNFLSEKKLDPIGNRFREALKKRVSILGFDGSSDNDVQFGQLNDMAHAGLAVIKTTGEAASKLNLSKLVDAAILYRRPDWRSRLQDSNRQLRCPRCRCLCSFITSKNREAVICLSCGLETPKEKARFRIALRRIDPEYVDLVHSLLTSKSRGLGVEPGPLTSPVGARNHNTRRCEYVPNSQDSKELLEQT